MVRDHRRHTQQFLVISLRVNLRVLLQRPRSLHYHLLLLEFWCLASSCRKCKDRKRWDENLDRDKVRTIRKPESRIDLVRVGLYLQIILSPHLSMEEWRGTIKVDGFVFERTPSSRQKAYRMT
ncbi:hypothetical protein B0J14DRAFT_693529 [Halenospora varia]|nr:hypothetical protein B0J14DRAFT_693529 [Halenospora varia]